MAQPDVTTAAAVASVLNTDAAGARFVAGYKAAEEAVRRRCRWPHGPVDPDDPDGDQLPAPADLVQSVILRTARYMARGNSPDGLVGMGELGAARVATIDRDVERLEGPWMVVVFG